MRTLPVRRSLSILALVVGVSSMFTVTLFPGSFATAAAPRPRTAAERARMFTVFSNPAAISIPDNTAVSGQSNITVAGLAGPISSVTLTLTGFSAPSPAGADDIDIILVGPGGQKFLFMSDIGGFFTPAPGPLNLTFSDAAAALAPNSGTLASGTYKPTNYELTGDTFNPPAPAGPYQLAAPSGVATFSSVFGGLSGASVNGTWSIFLEDDASSAGTQVTISGGWSLDIVTTPAASPTTTTVSSSLNPSNTNQAVTFTSSTTSSSTVNTGNVNFVDTTTGTTLCSNVAVNGSGSATCLVAANTLSERQHTIQATYVANATFSTSNGSVVQTVNFPTSQLGNTFTNAGGINMPDTTMSVPYPSNITVSGLSGSISKVTLSVSNVTFPQAQDLNFLLVGPAGQTFVFWSDAGGLFTASSNINLTFDDAAANSLPNSGTLVSGTFKPTDINTDVDTFPSPAPAGPYNAAAPGGSGTFASVFGGAAPNGTWRLFPYDDTGSGGVGMTMASWSLTFVTTGDPATTTVISGTPNPATTAQTVLYTAAVTSTSTVNSGTVTFRNGATILCANVAVSGGAAACTAGPFAQGDYVITADYNGSPGQFNLSSGSMTQQVNSPTIRTGNNFANNGGIVIPNSSVGNPYPSRILVSGLGGTISKVTLSLNGIAAPNPDHVDLVLVGPGGQKFLFMGDAGGTNAISGVNITLDDAAATALPDSTAIATGTYRPASYTGDSDIFPAPAPSGPYNPAAPEGTGTFATLFNGISPNGTWSLYAVEDTGDALNTSLTGWSLTFTLSPAATTTVVSSSKNPQFLGSPVTFTATVTTAGVTPTGSVQFLDGGNPLGGPVTLNASGQATLTTSSLTAGSHTITAQYSGNVASGFSASSGGMTQVVSALTAAGVTVSGRVFGLGGRGATNASVTLTDESGQSRSVVTGRLGAFAFDEVETGHTYVITVNARRFAYSPRAIQITDNISDLDFVPIP